MKLCFYSPYIPKHFGGGEKHLFDVALAAAEKHEVSIAISTQYLNSSKNLFTIQKEYELFTGRTFPKLSFIETPLGTTELPIQKLLWTGQFDGIYYVTDGSLFFSLARHNYLHIQTPIKIPVTFLQKLKLKNWSSVNTNSEFTKSVIEKEWQIKVQQVLHPKVDITSLETRQKKDKTILNVGRFFKQLHSKRQDIIVKLFSQMLKKYPKELKGWKLVLIGTVESESYFNEVKSLAKNLPVEFMTDVDRPSLLESYKAAAIYWHATGYGIDEEQHPEKVEHFGISTVEAMAAGAIPVTHLKGGQKEILGSELCELGWLTDEDCIEKTVRLISNQKKMDKMREAVVQRAEKFGGALFEKKVLQLFR